MKEEERHEEVEQDEKQAGNGKRPDLARPFRR